MAGGYPKGLPFPPDGGPIFYGVIRERILQRAVLRHEEDAMALAQDYRLKAAEFHARARSELGPLLRLQYENLARAYLRLAEQADRNGVTHLVYEPPPPKLSDVKP
jgi:hypothetical protein